MNIRKGNLVAKGNDDASKILSEPKQYESLNQAKKANGLNAVTCKQFPPMASKEELEAAK